MQINSIHSKVNRKNPKVRNAYKNIIMKYVTYLKNTLVFFMITLLALPLLSSCTKIESETEATENDVTVKIRMKNFEITNTPILNSRVTNTYPNGINRIAIAAFNANGEKAGSISLKDTDENFLEPSFRLHVGTYTFVVIAHTVLDGEDPVEITSPTLATLQGQRLSDIYSCVKNVTVTSSTAIVDFSMGNRINSRFWLHTKDLVPSDVKTILVTVNPNASLVPLNPTFDPTTGLATGSWKYQKNLIATEGEVFSRAFDILLPQVPFQTDIIISPRNGSQELTRFTQSFTGVTFNKNTAVHAKGFLFDPDMSFTLSFEEDWTQVEYPF